MIDYSRALRAISAGSFQPAYLFCGSEPFLIRELSHRLEEAYLGEDGGYGSEKVEGKEFTLTEVLQRLDGASLFASRKLLVVDEPPYLALKSKEIGTAAGGKGESGEENAAGAPCELESFIERESGAGIPARIILFRAANVDRRRRLFKMLEKRDAAVDCATLKEGDLTRWIRERLARQGKKIDNAALQRLLWSGENDLHTLSNELDKYCAYLGEGETTITAGVVELLFSGDTWGNVFTLTDALSKGNIHRAQQLLAVLAGKREEPLRIFFMLVRHFRLLLCARSLRDEKIPPARHPGELGVKPFEARKLYGQSASFSRESLEEIIIFLQGLDYRIKTGRVVPGQGLEMAIAGIHLLTPRR